MTVRVEHGDCRAVVGTLPDASVDAVVTDPPYSLVSIQKRFGTPGSAPVKIKVQPGQNGSPYARAARGFMGQQWDNGDTAFDPEFWADIYRVTKPGAHLVAFGGTRTYHRLACAIEDAGFEIRDQLAWCFASGFPKSHDVSKGIDKATGADREVLSSGAPVKRMIPGADQDKSGSWVKDNGREFVPTVSAPATDAARQWEGWGSALKPAWEPICLARKPLIGTIAANVLAHGTGAINVDGCRIPSEGGAPRHGESSQERRYTDSGSTNFAATSGPRGGAPEGRFPANLIHDGSDEVLAAFPDGAARFFFSAKADSDDRCDSKHPTVKPVALMRWLARLITPPGGTVLDPFAGSGTTGVACLREGFDAILIEREATYVADIRHRLAKLSGLDAPLFAGLSR